MAPAAALVTVGRDVDGPVAGQHDARDARALGRAQEGAEVAGIGDAVDGDEERRPSVGRGRDRQLVELGLRERLGPGDDALGRVGAGLGVELGAGRPAGPAPGGRRPARPGRRADRRGGRPRRPRPGARTCGAAPRAAARARPGGPRPGRRRGRAGGWRRRRWVGRRPSRARRRAGAAPRLPPPPLPRPPAPRPPATRFGRSGRRPMPRPPRPVPGHRRPRSACPSPSPVRRRPRTAGPASASRTGASFGLSSTTVQSTFCDRPARAAHEASGGLEQSTTESAPRHRSSVSGKFAPMSPSPAAPSSASVQAWATTSASLWPSRPRSPSNTTPPSTSGRVRVVAPAVHVEAVADPQLGPGHVQPRSRTQACMATRSCGVVILMLAGSPSTTSTVPADGLDQRGVVGGLGPVGVGPAQDRGPEGLGRLHGHEPRAVDRATVDLARGCR